MTAFLNLKNGRSPKKNKLSKKYIQMYISLKHFRQEKLSIQYQLNIAKYDWIDQAWDIEIKTDRIT